MGKRNDLFPENPQCQKRLESARRKCASMSKIDGGVATREGESLLSELDVILSALVCGFTQLDRSDEAGWDALYEGLAMLSDTVERCGGWAELRTDLELAERAFEKAVLAARKADRIIRGAGDAADRAGRARQAAEADWQERQAKRVRERREREKAE